MHQKAFKDAAIIDLKANSLNRIWIQRSRIKRNLSEIKVRRVSSNDQFVI